MQKEKQEIRIPRPLGATNLAKGGLRKELKEKVLKEYLRGSFPFPGQWVSELDLHMLYGIPLGDIERAVQSQMQENLIGTGEEGIKSLEKSQSQVMNSTLSRLGRSDLLLNQLLRHLLQITSQHANPLLFKEVNAAIGNQIRLSETSIKVINQIQEFLNLNPVPQHDPDVLSREEILEYLQNVSQPDASKYLEGTPSLRPIPGTDDSVPIPLPYSKNASHDFLKGEEVPVLPPKSDPPILPQ